MLYYHEHVQLKRFLNGLYIQMRHLGYLCNLIEVGRNLHLIPESLLFKGRMRHRVRIRSRCDDVHSCVNNWGSKWQRKI